MTVTCHAWQLDFSSHSWGAFGSKKICKKTCKLMSNGSDIFPTNMRQCRIQRKDAPREKAKVQYCSAHRATTNSALSREPRLAQGQYDYILKPRCKLQSNARITCWTMGNLAMCRSVNIVRTQKCLAFGIVGIIVFGNFHCLRRGCLPACLRRKQWVHTMVGTINKYNDVHSQHRRCPIVQLYWNLNRLWDCLLAKDTVFCMTGVFVRNFLV
jgi:hypothetical protein